MNKVENRIGYHSGGAVGRNGEFLIGAVVLGQKIYKNEQQIKTVTINFDSSFEKSVIESITEIEKDENRACWFTNLWVSCRYRRRDLVLCSFSLSKREREILID